ncbi:MAG: glycosyltransferase [Collinsella sp.]|nr:glycosyltransferase [Collinsella sp.]
MVLVFESHDVFVESFRLVYMTQKPVRVLQVIGAMDRGGAETLLMNLYRSMDRKRVQFDFLVNETRECDYDNEIKELGGHIYTIPRFNIVNGVSYKRHCSDFFNTSRYRIVHGHIGLPAPIYLKEASRSGAFTIAHSHAQNYPMSLNELVFRLCSYPVRYVADCYMACSKEAGMDRFGRQIADGPSFHVLKNGVDTDVMSFNRRERNKVRMELGIDINTPVFGHIGRLTSVKNHKFLLEVFLNICNAMPNSKLLLVGRGELESQLRESVEKMGLGNNVMFLGIRDDVSSILSAMDVFIFPSFSEGLSCAVIEAQSVGLQVLLSTGVPESAKILPETLRLDLSLGPQFWADNAMQLLETSQRYDRSLAKSFVIKAGFDIESSALWLQELYLRHA